MSQQLSFLDTNKTAIRTLGGLKPLTNLLSLDENFKMQSAWALSLLLEDGYYLFSLSLSLPSFFSFPNCDCRGESKGVHKLWWCKYFVVVIEHPKPCTSAQGIGWFGCLDD